MVDADCFVTGHQPCDEGFRQANHRQIIIDGTDPYPAYCLFPTTSPTTIEALLKCVHITRRHGRRSEHSVASSRCSDRGIQVPTAPA